MIIGAQLFTVAKSCKTIEDLEETLKRVADIGYRCVQLSGVCDFDPQWMDEQLKKNGLTCALTHTAMDRIVNETDKVCEEHTIFGCNNIGLGAMPDAKFLTDEVFENFCTQIAPALDRIKANGKKFYYHNHHWEFVRDPQGVWYMDRLLNRFGPDLLNITLDTYWVQYAGCDPVEWVEKLKGRLECLHLKDMITVQMEHRMAPVGVGNLNFEKILTAAEASGTKYALVEQDKCYDDDPFDCLAKSLAYLRALGYQD